MRTTTFAPLILSCAALACVALGHGAPGHNTVAASPGAYRVFLPAVVQPDDPDLAVIAAAADGLLYPSETDAPLTPFYAGTGLTPSATCALEAAPGDLVEVGNVGRVLDGPARHQLWMTPEEQATAARFALLKDMIEDRLESPISCRVGRIAIRILIVGTAPSGRVVGLRTLAVET